MKFFYYSFREEREQDLSMTSILFLFPQTGKDYYHWHIMLNNYELYL